MKARKAARKASAVRIFAGQWKRRLLEVPSGARPTSGRAREALFNILQKRIPGARVLDLYSGSGAVGLEAISRGAARAVLVEKNADVLRRNVTRLPPAEGEVAVMAEDARTALEKLASGGERFDLIFADPPYGTSAAALRAQTAHLLAPRGIFVLQSDRFEDPDPGSTALTLVERRDYGRNVFSFFAADAAARPSPPRRLL